LPTEGESVPRDVAGGDCGFHSAALVWRSLLEIFVKQPRASGPNVAIVAGEAHFVRDADGARKVLGEITMHYGCLRVDEAGIEMTFENDEDALDLGIGCWRNCGRSGLRGKGGERFPESGTAQREDRRFYEFTALHACSFLF
jgi:hypothetical protein